MKLRFTLEEAACLKVGLEMPGMKEKYDYLIDSLVRNTAVSREEAQRLIFPDFAKALIRAVKEAADAEIVMRRVHDD